MHLNNSNWYNFFDFHQTISWYKTLQQWCIVSGDLNLPKVTWKSSYIFFYSIDGLVQGCSISSALAIEIQQSCTKPSMFTYACQIPSFRISIFPRLSNYRSLRKYTDPGRHGCSRSSMYLPKYQQYLYKRSGFVTWQYQIPYTGSCWVQ